MDLIGGELAAVAGAAGWGLSSVIVKPALPRVRALQVNFIYVMVAAAIGLAVAAAAGQLGDAFAISGASAALLAVGAVIGTTGDVALIRAISFQDVGRPFTTASAIFILTSVLGEWLLQGHPPTAWVWFGGAAILAGIYLANVPKSEVGPAHRSVVLVRKRLSLRGSPLPFAISAGVLWALSLLMLEAGMRDSEPVAANALANLAPAFVYGVWAAVWLGPRPVGIIPSDALKVSASGFIFGAAILSAMFALKLSSAAITSVLISSSPLFAVILGALFLRERIPLRPLTGIGLSLMGIFAIVGAS